RKIIKRPAGTFGYHVTAIPGMRDQIIEVYKDQHEENEPPGSAAEYLATRIMDVCREELRKPAQVMDLIVAIALHLANNNLPLHWITPSGFPVRNDYSPPKLVQVGRYIDGRRVRALVACGYEDLIKDEDHAKKAANAAAPNFVHSLDASHAAGVIN